MRASTLINAQDFSMRISDCFLTRRGPEDLGQLGRSRTGGVTRRGVWHLCEFETFRSDRGLSNRCVYREGETEGGRNHRRSLRSRRMSRLYRQVYLTRPAKRPGAFSSILVRSKSRLQDRYHRRRRYPTTPRNPNIASRSKSPRTPTSGLPEVVGQC